MKMLAPGTAASYSVADGTLFSPGLDGTLDVPVGYVGALTLLGWTPLVDMAVDPTSGRPVTGLQAGMQWFDSSLAAGAGKPIWRNSANTGWIDATGAAV